MIELDGAYGEGGGQLLRTALALSAVTGKTFRIARIRARRSTPGLRAQHLTAVHAVGDICRAQIEGAELGSRELVFAPTAPTQPGSYRWEVGTAGSAPLILQAVLWPMALAPGRSELELVGGTHVAWSPPVDYVIDVYLWLLASLAGGPVAEVHVGVWGWYPRGGGVLRAVIPGETSLAGLDLVERGSLRYVSVLSAVSRLPAHILERQAAHAEQALRKQGIRPHVTRATPPSPGPGTMVYVLAEYDRARAGFTAYGELRKPAERVAEEACQSFLRYHRRAEPVDRHLADQLVLPLALCGAPSRYAVSCVTQHLLTQAWLVQRFLGVEIAVEGRERERGMVRIGGSE
ncbi:MAG: RNA 3'-terminal phosphate cyclase [Anaerolineae bacterium]|nr:RNA 3'-terminal phosphate cyclase [Anaerolineae bacterium]